MFKHARNNVKKLAGNRLQMLFSLSFLIDCGLWFWALHAPKDDFVETVLKAMIAILFSVITFEWVALGLAILCIPLKVIISALKPLEYARNNPNKISGNRLRLFLSLSFLSASGLWFWGLHAPKDGFGEIILEAILAIFLGLITFEFVAVALVILCLPLWVLYRNIRGR